MVVTDLRSAIKHLRKLFADCDGPTRGKLVAKLIGLPDKGFQKLKVAWQAVLGDPLEEKALLVDVLLAAAATPPSSNDAKTVHIVFTVSQTGEDVLAAPSVCISSPAKLKDILRNANSLGLFPVDDGWDPSALEQPMAAMPSSTGGEMIVDLDKLEDGKYYLLSPSGSAKSVVAMRQEMTHLGFRREDEVTQALHRDVIKEDPTCSIEPSLRILKDPTGRRDEMESDGVVMCGAQAFLVSHKTSFSGASSMVEDIAKAARKVEQQCQDTAYASTGYAYFKGKKIAPVFMAEHVADGSKANLLKASQRHNTRLYRRDGHAIIPWASLMRPQHTVSAVPRKPF